MSVAVYISLSLSCKPKASVMHSEWTYPVPIPDKYLVMTVSPSCKESTCLQHDHQAPVFVCRHSIYYGDAQLATEWFHKLGYTIPYLINAADFILDLASGDVSTNKITGAESRLHLISCAETFLSVSPACHQLTLLFCP